MLGLSKASLSFKIPGTLAKYGVKTPGIRAAIKKHKPLFQLVEIHISEAIPKAISLRDFVHANIYTDNFSREQKLDFYRSFAQFLANIHKAGVYHGDFSARNIFVENDPEKNYPLYLLDLDAVRSVKWISRRRRIKNLDEIGRNFKDYAAISLLDRARVVRFYLKFYEKEQTPFKTFFQEICQRNLSSLH